MSDEEIYRKYSDELVRFATGLVGPADAADVVSDAVARVLASARWPEARDRRAYLFGSVLNELVYELMQAAPPAPPMPIAALTEAAPSRARRVRVIAALLVVAIVVVTATVVVIVRRSPAHRGSVVAPAATVAPDVAFVDRRGLVVRSSGSARDVVVAPGAVSTPRWSPSGKWLAYRKGNDLWIVQRNGDGREQIDNLANYYFEDAFAWSPTADALATVGKTGLHLWWLDGGGPPHEVVINFPGGGAQVPVSMAWSHGGTSLAVATELREQIAPQAAVALDSLWVATDVCRAYTSSVSCRVPALRKLAYTPGRDEYPTGVAGFAFDDRYVLIWPDYQGSGSIELDGLPLKAVPVDGGPVVKVAPSVLVRDSWVQSSPDGSRLAVVFSNGRMVTDNRTLQVCEAPSQCVAPASVPAVQTVDPAWSADGLHIAFVREEPATLTPPLTPDGGIDWTVKYRTRQLWIADSDGSDARVVTEAGHGVASPQFSPDGRTIVFVRDAQVWQLDLSTRQLTVLSGSMRVDPSCMTNACLPDAAVYDTEARWSDHMAVIFPATSP